MNKGVIFPFALCLLFILSAGCDKGQQGGEAKKPEQKPSESINPVFALAKDNVFLIGASDVGYLGTAFLVNFKEKRYAVTNFHVIERSRDFFLENESRIAFKDVTVVAADRKNDVAVLKVNGLLDSMKGLNYSTEYLTSQKIYISGYPDTKSKENHINFGSGVISDANYVAKNYIGKGDGKSLQFTIEINPGSSGSPVMNEKGDVLGVVAWYRPDVKGGNYAVPFNYVLDLLVEIENTKQNFSEI
ncbi:MAG: trypsin-like peptidase domain-containing protein, partial [Deltaproteobacteria bacterium]|nr:trypsin-like peptidase domain-containing protein [Deltaproteobacteria bacterium]